MSAALAGRHVVVTGGAGALGGAVVEALGAAGAVCHVPARGAELTGRAGVMVTPHVDLTDDEQVTAYYAGLPPLWASVHLAGGFAMAPILETTLADLRGQLELNLTTAFLCCREAVRAMRAGGGGRIVNVAARPALVPAPGMIAYTTAKAAVVSLTRCLAAEVLADGILVNAVAPSLFDTPANRAAMPDADHRRWPQPAEVAAAIAFLVSPASSLVSGEILPVYGQV